MRLISVLGLITIFISMMVGFDAVCDALFRHDAPSGYATIIIMLAFLGGLQLVCLGIIGEYLGQIFREVKARPRYIKESELFVTN